MTVQDVVMILVYTFPMFLFTIYPGIVVGDYLQKNYELTEKKKRAVIIAVTFLGALMLAVFLQFA
ncbi:MAG: hypothetical protein U9P71_06775 [Campylobacterota bacterium]|nr:hypothetical protein [Campylobacterota bacterium]